MHDIRYNAVHDEILVTNPFSNAILTFRGGATGEEPPIRVIQGPRTRIRGSDTLEVDPVHNEIYVPSGNELLVFQREAQGDVAPIRIIRAPGLGRGTIAVDPVNNVTIVARSGQKEEGRLWNRPWIEHQEHKFEKEGGSLLIFGRTDSGDVKPRAVIEGPKTGLWALRQLQVYPPKGWIIVPQASGTIPEPEEVSIGVWHINDNGDVPPRWKIEGPKSALKRPRGVAINPKDKEIYVADGRYNGVLTYYFPEIF